MWEEACREEYHFFRESSIVRLIQTLNPVSEMLDQPPRTSVSAAPLRTQHVHHLHFFLHS